VPRASVRVETASRAEKQLVDIESELVHTQSMDEHIQACKELLARLDDDIDAEYAGLFSRQEVVVEGVSRTIEVTSDEGMQLLSKEEPQVLLAFVRFLECSTCDVKAEEMITNTTGLATCAEKSCENGC
jgi:hypothetical protein